MAWRKFLGKGVMGIYLLTILPPNFAHLALIQGCFNITFCNERSAASFLGWCRRATVISRITLAQEVAIFYKKVAREMGGQMWVLDREV